MCNAAEWRACGFEWIEMIKELKEKGKVNVRQKCGHISAHSLGRMSSILRTKRGRKEEENGDTGTHAGKSAKRELSY